MISSSIEFAMTAGWFFIDGIVCNVIMTLRLLTTTVSTPANSALCHIIIVCTVTFSFSLNMTNGFVQIERWTILFQVLRVVRD
jgi:hypothetical protein